VLDVDFRMLVSVVRQAEEVKRPARDRILAALRLKAASKSELQRRTGISVGTIRNNLFGLIKGGEVIGDRGRPKTYQLVPSVSRKTSQG
jgi:hypothetical protein